MVWTQLTEEPTYRLCASWLPLQKKKNENNKIWFREKQKEKFEKAFKKKKWKESCALVLLQSQPPMCFSPMNTLGTVRCPVHSARAD